MPPEPVQRVVLYTDGGADPNPGPGGWGVVLLHPTTGTRRELSGGEPKTTNNRMELTAAIQALETLKRPCQVEVFTDSQYVRKGISQWLPGWIARGWKRKDGEIKNLDLWRRLAEVAERHQIQWRWVKGHAGHEHNERADQLATLEIRKLRGKGAAGAAATERAPSEAAQVEVFLKVSHHKGRGAWAALVRRGETEDIRTGEGKAVSANQMEIEAAAELLDSLPQGELVDFLTASDYLRNGASQWLAGWRRRGWKTADGNAVKNAPQWRRLDAALGRRRVRWPTVKGADKRPEFKALAKLTKATMHGEDES